MLYQNTIGTVRVDVVNYQWRVTVFDSKGEDRGNQVFDNFTDAFTHYNHCQGVLEDAEIRGEFKPAEKAIKRPRIDDLF